MNDLWNSIVRNLEGKLDAKELKTWFAPTEQRSFQEGTARAAPLLTVSVPSRVFSDWIETRHGTLLAQEAAAAGFPGLSFRFESGANEKAPTEVATSPASGRGLVLNPRYTFDTFVVGSSNQFAHAAARAVAESPSRSYNPLFLYGGVGLGKTHLMHAIAHEILRRSPGMHVFYLSAERFLNELINALRFEKMHEFKQRYRELDVLLMDDVQFIAGKDSTQQEFFHTFNALHDAQKQIVVTSDALPKEIPTLEERLRSRFEWGLVADIQPPDLEMKVAIIRKKAAAEKVGIPNDVALFIAGTVKSNVRELEGRLNRVLAFSSLTGKPLSVELARETLKDILGTEENRAAPSEILKAVATHYGLRV
ncbi:MAG TPA: chromosomal replication initiator protein DnaA, partial [Thermoanaerobaculia bacterium]|nr:chromosomal replication initiator protein DnaA [Thermoanaerobaculia bacterium]